MNAAISAISALPGAGDAIGAAIKATRAAGKVGSLAAKSATIGTRVGQVGRAVLSNVASDSLEQGARIYFGQQESFHWERTVGAAVSAGSLGYFSVGVGRTFNASRNAVARAAVLSAGSGAAAALGDAATQAGAIYAGRQESYSLMQTATAFGGGVLAGAAGQMAGLYDKTCFAGDTPMIARNEQGWIYAENVKVNDYLASRDENDPEGPVTWQRVEEVFVAQAELWEVHWNGQTIRTTAEHPFYVYELGWTPARELKPGSLLATMDGRYLPVESVISTRESETVYNFRVADDHTYFVGKPEWGCAVWVHNRCQLDAISQLGQTEKGARASLRRALGGVPTGQQAHHLVPWELRSHSVIKKAAKAGFGINGGMNGVLLNTTVHLGSHPRYTAAVQSKLDSIAARGLSSKDTAIELQMYVNRLRAGLQHTSSRLK